jgi:hypothetical protein
VLGLSTAAAIRIHEATAVRTSARKVTPMTQSVLFRLTLVVALANCIGACQTERQNIPNLTLADALKLPPDKLPKIFRDPTNPYGYPYNVHETDGLSRNPDDCGRWGCVDVGGGNM